MENNLKKTSLALNEEEYDKFKKFCKLNNSDASKEIRKIIKEYNLKFEKKWKPNN
jgi:hypothetical protein